ncbi:flagellar export protein FliJ [Halobacillus shinanisalinarum]|uniref:Flagellar FliJ protein n=1 Tax=Halobacillus shinanisalinarum TaxID=2932258 RepID=A0ABY4GYE5_9BACI|nr:flagellar export protein FliJ [Halobacillus shinanisalinarum]UOQ93221.1 flagellar export protein FliJ [Halobacillus shinanisalinarum]
MTSLQAFHKIKDLHEREKKEKQKHYQEQVDVFESLATNLYEMLKKKEAAEQSFHEGLTHSKVKAQSFIHHRRYVEQLENEIMKLQPEVQQARAQMEAAQARLSSAHVEVKKFEKLIDNKLERHRQWLKEEESKQMDELSTRQYLTYKNR